MLCGDSSYIGSYLTWKLWECRNAGSPWTERSSKGSGPRACAFGGARGYYYSGVVMGA